jgi:hypothetical protein
MSIQYFLYSANAEKLGGIMIYECNGEAIVCTEVCNTLQETQDYNWADKKYLGQFENAKLIWEGIIY